MLQHRGEDLHRSVDALDTFFDRSRDLNGIAGTDGYLQRVNPAWTVALGWSAEELRAKPFPDWVHPDDREQAARVVGGLAGAEAAFESRCLCKDGAYRRVQWSSRLRPHDGLVYLSGHDVTDQPPVAPPLDTTEAWD
jgi:PAS domain S-box-containing protein